MPESVVYTLPVDPAQAVVGPVSEIVGKALTVTFFIVGAAEEHPLSE